MGSLKPLLRIFLTAWVAGGCGQDPAIDPRVEALASSEAGRADRKQAGADQAAVPDQARQDQGSATGTCPCPLDSYCELSTKQCVPGCRLHEHCSLGKYCDASTGQCFVGCRMIGDCADNQNPCTSTSCVNGKCLHAPNTAPCADDGNACTADVCSNGSCTHPPRANGTVCGAVTDCLALECEQGACIAKKASSGTSCTDDGNSCTTDTCDGQGACQHPALADDTSCTVVGDPSSGKCHSGGCKLAINGCTNVGGTTNPWVVYCKDPQTKKFYSCGTAQTCICYGSTFKAGTLSQTCAICKTISGPSVSGSVTCYK